MNTIQVADYVLLIDKKYDLISPFFTNPIISTTLEIFVFDSLSLNLKT